MRLRLAAGSESLIQVSNIHSEYEYVRAAVCKCSGGFEVTGQTLTWDFTDLLHVRCVLCGEKREFEFDVTKFFGKEPPEAAERRVRWGHGSIAVLLELWVLDVLMWCVVVLLDLGQMFRLLFQRLGGQRHAN